MLESASRGGLPGPGGVCLVLGKSAWSRGVEVSAWSQGGSAWSRGGLPGPGGVGVSPWSQGGSAWSWGVCLVGGLPGCGGYGIPACTEADTLPPCGQTHTCQNITVATTSLWPVMTQQDDKFSNDNTENSSV